MVYDGTNNRITNLADGVAASDAATVGQITAGTGTVTSASFTGGLISVATPTTTPAFTVAGTSGGIPYFSGATTWESSAALTANALVIGGGAGVAPSTTTTGTGVLTFLGTPSSANLAAAVTDETGTGALVFGTSPTFTGTVAGITSAMVGLGSVDNTSDAGKPVSTAQQTALNLKSNTASPAFTGSFGYASGQGGTVTQATSKATGVTLNKICGQITMNGAALAAAAEVAFTLTNSFIASTDVIIVNIQSVGTAGAYFVDVGAVANGSCSITLGNTSAGSLSQAVVLNFIIIKSVNA